MATPQQTYESMAAAGVARINAPWRKQAVQGFMAGAYVSLGALFANLMEADIIDATQHSHDARTSALANLVGGAVFPIGLIAIFLTGANLFTGNCMYVVPTLINGRASRGRALAFLAFSWLCNFVGAAFVVYFIAHLGEWTTKDPVKDFVRNNATKKINLGWGVALLRGIGANWLVCLAWWQALSARDTVSKILSVWWPVFTFTAIGFEHSIANMFYVDIGLVEGADKTFWEFLGHNLIPVTIGNFLGGAVFLGAVQWFTYAEDAAGSEKAPLLPAKDVEDGAGVQGVGGDNEAPGCAALRV